MWANSKMLVTNRSTSKGSMVSTTTEIYIVQTNSVFANKCRYVSYLMIYI